MAAAVLRDGGEHHLPVPLLVSQQTVPRDNGEHQIPRPLLLSDHDGGQNLTELTSAAVNPLSL
jgi:hypothetical protein